MKVDKIFLYIGIRRVLEEVDYVRNVWNNKKDADLIVGNKGLKVER